MKKACRWCHKVVEMKGKARFCSEVCSRKSKAKKLTDYRESVRRNKMEAEMRNKGEIDTKWLVRGPISYSGMTDTISNLGG